MKKITTLFFFTLSLSAFAQKYRCEPTGGRLLSPIGGSFTVEVDESNRWASVDYYGNYDAADGELAQESDSQSLIFSFEVPGAKIGLYSKDENGNWRAASISNSEEEFAAVPYYSICRPQ